MKKEPKTKPKERTENQIRQDEFLATFSTEETTHMEDVLNILLDIAELPSHRRGAIFGNRAAKVACHERIQLTGLSETTRILQILLTATKRHEPFRPTFSTPTLALSTGWQKIVAFTDSYTKKNKGAITIGDNALRAEIAKGLSQS